MVEQVEKLKVGLGKSRHHDLVVLGIIELALKIGSIGAIHPTFGNLILECLSCRLSLLLRHFHGRRASKLVQHGNERLRASQRFVQLFLGRERKDV